MECFQHVKLKSNIINLYLNKCINYLSRLIKDIFDFTKRSGKIKNKRPSPIDTKGFNARNAPLELLGLSI